MHLFIVIHSDKVSFYKNGFKGSNPHNGSLVDVKKQIVAIQKAVPHETVEYRFE